MNRRSFAASVIGLLLAPFAYWLGEFPYHWLRPRAPRWKNWTGRYTNLTEAEMRKKLLKALSHCEFRPPLPPCNKNDFSFGLAEKAK